MPTILRIGPYRFFFAYPVDTGWHFSNRRFWPMVAFDSVLKIAARVESLTYRDFYESVQTHTNPPESDEPVTATKKGNHRASMCSATAFLAKFWLNAVVLASSRDFASNELRTIQKHVDENYNAEFWIINSKVSPFPFGMQHGEKR